MPRFSFAFDPLALPLRLVGISPSTSWVDVAEGRLAAQFGPWRCRTELANVRDVEVTEDHLALKVIGPRLSFADGGATYGTSTGAAVCICFHEPVAALAPVPLHPALTVTVADVDGLATLLRERCGLPA